VPLTENQAEDLGFVKTYLGREAEQWSDDTLLDAISAEKADQARRLLIPDPVPYSLRAALCRRVAHSLAMRALPLGITQSDTGSMYLGSRDPEVRRLEAPYRKVIVG
jgi:hypothetical protein